MDDHAKAQSLSVTMVLVRPSQFRYSAIGLTRSAVNSLWKSLR